MVRQPEVTVGTQHQNRLALDDHLRVLGGGNGPKVGASAQPLQLLRNKESRQRRLQFWFPCLLRGRACTITLLPDPVKAVTLHVRCLWNDPSAFTFGLFTFAFAAPGWLVQFAMANGDVYEQPSNRDS
jgi:hypothetical protein